MRRAPQGWRPELCAGLQEVRARPHRAPSGCSQDQVTGVAGAVEAHAIGSPAPRVGRGGPPEPRQRQCRARGTRRLALVRARRLRRRREPSTFPQGNGHRGGAREPGATAARDVGARSRRVRRRDRKPRWRGEEVVTRYVLLLRGVNVGTKNSLPMAELRSMLLKVGCGDVQTYVQSGNAVFGTKLGTTEVTKAIEHALERYMGRPIATTLRTCKHMKAIVEANPFANVATTPSNLCVTFLSTAPTKPEVAPLHAQDWAPDLFKVAGKEIYTWHPHGQGQSRLREALWKLPLRRALTARNWNTVSG